MAFAQLTYRESLRDIEACLGSLQGQAVSPGIPWQGGSLDAGGCERSRDWRIFADFAQRLIAIARGLYVREPMGVDSEQSRDRWLSNPEHTETGAFGRCQITNPE